MDEYDHLYGEYLKVLEELRKLDAELVATSDQPRLLTLIEQRRPLHERLEQIYSQIMDAEEREREALLKQAQRCGAVTMKGKEIKTHKNGVKISVSKSYLDDKMLDSKTKYTVILLPE